MKGKHEAVSKSGVVVLGLLGSIKFVASYTRHSRVRLSRLLAYGAIILSATLPISHSVQSAPTASSSSVWFVEHKTLKRIDAVSHEQQAEVFLDKEIETLAVDGSDQSVWVLGEKTLRKFDSQLIPVLSIELKDLRKAVKAQSNNKVHLEHGEKIIADAFSGDLWLIGEKGVVVLSRGGALQASYRTDDKIEDFTLSLNQHAWLLTKKSLIEIDSGGSVIRSTTIKGIIKDPERLAIDSLANVVWVAGKKSLYRFNATNLGEAPVTVTLPSVSGKEKIEAETITIDPVSGVVWLAGEHKLRVFNRTGELLFERDFKADGIKEAELLSWDPVSGTLYIGGKKTLSQYRLDGTLVWQIPMDKKLRALGTAPFSISPVVSIIAPPDGVHTNDARPPIEFKLGANCNSNGCDALASYLDSLNIQATLDNIVIGSSFIVGNGSAKYLPTEDLTEGNHEIAGQAIDPFNHFSNLAQGTFIVDTIAPVFENVSPADDTSVNAASITIEGKVVDASPVNVMLLNDVGTVLSLTGGTFSFLTTLEPGLNTFKLSAQDAAGNKAERTLRITRGEPVKITIGHPTDGGSISGDSVLVTGTFEGPANTGVTVNGIVALVNDTSFSANGVPISEGINTLTATVTTPGGATATDAVTVTRAGTAQFAVDVSLSRFEKQTVMGIDTYAGGGTKPIVGEVDAKEAVLPSPAAVAVAPDGTLYISDERGCRIYRVSPQQQISLFAGTGVCGFGGDGGPALEAQLDDPAGIEVAADGSVYFSDSSNFRIRRISTDGIISTVAGNGVSGFSGDGGPATEAQIDWAYEIALGNQGGFYIADSTAHRIRYVAPDGVIRTVAGTGIPGNSGDGGLAVNATMYWPDIIATGPDGSIYVQDSGNNRIRRIGPDGIMTAFAGTGASGFTGDGGPATSARLKWMWGLAVDPDGTVYISDSGNERIRMVTSDGKIETFAGNGVRGFGGDGGDPKLASISSPGLLTVSADGSVYFPEWSSRRIRIIGKFREDLVKIPVGMSSALAPLDAAFIVTHLNGGTISKVEVDFDGDGSTDHTTTDSTNPIEHNYSSPGLYNVTLKVTDDQGQHGELAAAILVMDAEAMDKVFKEIWNGMNQALVNGDVSEAVTYLNYRAIRKYKPVFEALLPHLPGIVASYSPVQSVSLGSQTSEYGVVTNVNGQKRLFLIHFIRDADGIWRLDAM